MRHSVTLAALVLLTAIAAAGCGSDSSTSTPTEPTPVAISESFVGTLTVNGLQVHVYTVGRAGTTSAQITTASDPAATFALSLGTWNGTACQIIITNPAALLDTAVTGTAQNTGQFCVVLNDVGKLTAALDYTVVVTHY